jgi:hypothetical protein
MGRVARIVVLALAVVSAGLVAQPAWAAPPLPASMAAIGDSITRAYDVCCAYGDHPGQSWSTGSTSYDGITSHYERIRQLNPAITGHASNDAVTGAKMAAAPTQAGQTVGQGARYVTILLGANDLCTSSPSTMTSTDSFRASFSQAMTTLMAQDPDPYVFVASIPNLYQLWQVLHTNSLARWAWANFHICQSMLAATNTDTPTPAGGDSRAGLQRDPGRGLRSVQPLPLGQQGGLQQPVQRQSGQHPGLLPSQPQRPGRPGQGDLGRVLVAQQLNERADPSGHELLKHGLEMNRCCPLRRRR